MIPHKLQLKNFLSYGPELQTIDFTRYHLICLSGKNGHGKSALLDAMTWAIWGQARKVSGASKADEGLLRLGETQMLVIFDFECNSNMYRVRREYMRTYGKPVASLEFGIVEPDTGQFTPLTDKTIRATQAKIESTLHLDFDAFTNTAFLRQGSANEFSKKSPKERKKILANILGLDTFEAVRRLAMDKIKDAQSEKNVINAFQEQQAIELEKIPAIKTDIAVVEKELARLEKDDQELLKRKEKLEQKQAQFQKDKQAYDLLTYQRDELIKDQNKLRTELRLVFTEWRTIHRQTKHGDNKAQLEQQKKQLIEKINGFQKKLQAQLECKEKILKTKEELHKLEQTFTTQENKRKHTHELTVERLLQQEKTLTDRMSSLEKTIEDIAKEQAELSQQHETIIKALPKQTVTPEKLTILQAQFDKRKNAYHQFVAQGNFLSQELKDLQQKESLVRVDDPSCPLCEQNLSATRKKFLHTKFTKQSKTIAHRLQRLRKLIPKLKQTLFAQHEVIESAKKIAEQHRLAQVSIDEIQKAQKKRLEQKEVTQKERATIQKQLTEITKQIAQEKKKFEQATKTTLKNNKQYQEAEKKLTAFEKELQANAYDQAAHKKETGSLQTVESKLEALARLDKQQALQDERKKTVRNLCKTLKQNKQQQDKNVTETKKYATLKDTFTSLQINAQKLFTEQKQNTEKKQALFQQKGSLETQLKKLHETEKALQKQQAKVKQLNQIIEDYQIISTATSKDGIQALLIEDAIPEIEQEANELLSRLSNNQAQIFIESLRDLKKGGTKETLDIKISDTAGIRPYELFSGGEAFRIDFALRIAISKLLARRAGTALQTLIIDEGFGSQDEEGLQHIMDALYTIQNDFAKIIIVSHLPAMKDQFPVHFFIQKGAQGSSVQVFEQG